MVRRLVQRHLVSEGWEVRGLAPVYSRYKGVDGGLVTYRVDVAQRRGEARTSFVSVRTGPPSRLESQAERFRDPSWAKRALPLQPFHLDADTQLLLYAFPLDRGMRDLHRALRPKWIGRWLAEAPLSPPASTTPLLHRKSTVTVLSYRPERRAVLRLDAAFEGRAFGSDSFVLRMHADPRRARPAVVAGAALQVAGVAAPATLGMLRPDLSIERHCTGTPLPATSIDNDVLMRAVGRHLARVHAVVPPTTLEVLDHSELHLRALRCAQDLARVHVGLGAWAERCAMALLPAPPVGPRVLLHGDLHPGQVLVEGPRLLFVDWDRSCAGDPEYDLGVLAAHLFHGYGRRAERAFQAVTRGYRDGGGLLDEPRLHWHQAHALLRLVDTPHRSVRPDWPERTEWILTRLEEVARC
ncbi:MAG: aminoglycoside phosphotransferase family protein [Gemmatimonadetes bacterium]|nr:aminoglycoside phosphotransferase family protein [Gemmatimonadota bacterium]